MDLHAVERVEIPAGGWAGVGTGLTIEIPPGFEGQVRPRSGLALRRAMYFAPSVSPGSDG